MAAEVCGVIKFLRGCIREGLGTDAALLALMSGVEAHYKLYCQVVAELGLHLLQVHMGWTKLD